MYFLPFVKYTINSEKGRTQLLEKFENNVCIVEHFSYYKQTNPFDFEGILIKDGFKLKRILKFGYSSLLPIAYARFIDYDKGRKVEIKIRFNTFVSVFSILVMLFLLIISFNNLESLVFALGIYTVLIYFFNLEIKCLDDKVKGIIETR